MTGVLKCRLDCLNANLLPMLRSFPDISHITITRSATLSDMDLQTLTAFPYLATLYLDKCNAVTPMGLLALCMRLPQLREVDAIRCAHLHGPAFELLAQLLDRYGLCVSITGGFL